jgi:L-alanine-DL-glutamate epimerase-like enolase superfamily enzyme
MRISDVTIFHLAIPFRRPFGHALQWRDRTETIVLCISSDSGLKGWGEILPRSYLRSGSIDVAMSRELPQLVSSWRGRTFDGVAQLLAALDAERVSASCSLATFAGWELALLDLAGKMFGFNSGDVLGQPTRRELKTGMVIGFDVETAELERHCLLLRMAGRQHIKVKVGRTDDLHRLQIVNAVFGPATPIRIDVNSAWSADEAILQLQRLRQRNVCSVEQPVSADDLDGMRKVREKTGIPVVADESVRTMADARSIVQARAADVLNIRIAKCGGFRASLELVKFARDSGLSCQLGTLVGETGILSGAAEIFGERVEGFEFLEGKLQNKRLLVEDIVEEAGWPEPYGFGTRVGEQRLAKWQISPSEIFQQVQGVAI